MKRSVEWFVSVVAVALFGTLFVTLSPSIAGGDSGELVAEGCILGTAHPPGYPLFTMIVYAISRFNGVVREYILTSVEGASRQRLLDALGSIAYNVNMSSALLTSGAAYCIGLIVSSVSLFRPKKGPLDDGSADVDHSCPILLGGTLLSMGLFTFSPLIWQYAVTAEVFPLNTFFASLILLLVLRFAQRGYFWIAKLGALVCGLALCNQHTIVLYEVPLIMYMAFLLRPRLIAKPVNTCLWLGGAFFLGLSPYFYLYIAGMSPKHGSWGHLSTISGFVHHFLRRDYGTFKLFSGEQGRNAEGFSARNKAYFEDATNVQGLYCAPMLALLAILFWRGVVDADVADSSGAVSSPPTATPALIPTVASPPPSTKQQQGAKGNNKTGKVQQLQPQPSRQSNKPLPRPPLLVGDCQVFAAEADWAPVVLFLTQVFYFGVFHSLANLPLSNRLHYGINQRFWMQPNVLLFTWAGIGFDKLFGLLVWMLGLLVGGRAKQQKSSSSVLFSRVLQLANVVAAACIVYAQHSKWYTISNQSDAYYWKGYASAILEPLPPNSVLLINYDMQWTSVRYMQMCEKFRDDVIAINLSMMTYAWFHEKRKLYPTLTWPGTYLAPPNDPRHEKNKAFTLRQWLDVNVDNHPVFLGGKVNYADPKLEEGYSFVPSGLVSKIVPHSRLPNATAYNLWNQQCWQLVVKNLNLPNMTKYPEETWEWTINRDFRDRVIGTSRRGVCGGACVCVRHENFGR